MIGFARTDRSLVGTWWWTVDRVMLAGLAVLAIMGIVIVFTASPPVAVTINRESSYFIVKHLTFIVPAAALLFGTSLLAPLGVLRLALGLLGLFGGLLLLTPFFGTEIKGAHRWIALGGVLVQPSEFVKPALAVVVARLIARKPGLAGLPEALALAGFVVALLLKQPDLGMTAVIVFVLAVQLFVAGLPWLVVVGFGAAGAFGAWAAYKAFPHVAARVDGFFGAPAEFTQVETALRAVAAGGIFGRGPGEGVQKLHLPDAHTDFVFAATAEEFGIIACLLLVALFLFLILRGLWRVAESSDRFCQLAATGLVCQFGLQALINMAVNLNLMPTKGMTLPFISYGGSSMLALAVGMGALLALTRRGVRLEVR